MNKLLLIATLLCLFATPKAHSQKNLPLYSTNVLYVKMVDDAGYSIKEQQLFLDGHVEFTNLSRLGWWSRVNNISDAKLQELRSNAARKLKRSMPDPTAAFHFHLYNSGTLNEALKALQAAKGVQKVLRIPIPRNAQAPDMKANQTYFFSGFTGIDADSVRLIYNNRGAGIRICDIEYDFNRNHADLPAVTILGATPANPFSDDYHGTAVLGEIASKEDGMGTTGIAPDCQLFFAAACTLPDTTYDLEAPILAAAATFSPGDIILLEQQIVGPNYDTISGSTTQYGLVPVEWYEPYYDAIQLAIGNDITVIEAAGNGQQNLDSISYQTGNGGHYPFIPGNGSGAIMVGASDVGSALGGIAAARSRAWYSNYGHCVGVQASGERVTTTGYGDSYATEGKNKYYTATFGGTSSASPIVTGGVALLQSVYKSRTGGHVLSPDQILSLLISTGKDQQNGVNGTALAKPIGPMPNIYAAIKSVLSSTGVNHLANTTVARVFPNPTSGQLTIKFPEVNESLQTTVSVFNFMGVAVRTYIVEKNTSLLNLNLENLSAGTYQVFIQNEKGSSVESIAVLH